MSGRFKSNPFFLERIKIVKDIKESVETFSIISKREGITDHFTMFVHDETVVFELRQVQADETGHNDTSNNICTVWLTQILFRVITLLWWNLKVNLLINTQNKKDCGRSYFRTVSSWRIAVWMKHKSTVHISITVWPTVCLINYLRPERRIHIFPA